MSEFECRKVKSKQDLDAVYRLREKVFVQEQGLFNSSDRDVYDECAIHIAAFFNGRIIGAVRIYQGKKGIWWGGRLAVEKRFRGRVGRLLVQAAVRWVNKKNAARFLARIQQDNIEFFKSLKWTPRGKEFVLHGIKHQLMEAALK